jgi:hypothetical protein
MAKRLIDKPLLFFLDDFNIPFFLSPFSSGFLFVAIIVVLLMYDPGSPSPESIYHYSKQTIISY